MSLPPTAWLEGKDYVKIADGFLGPFGSRRYESRTGLLLRDCGLELPAGLCSVADARMSSHWDLRRYGDRVDLWVWSGTQYDGPSGPTYDDAHNMRAACVHDIAYRALRDGKLGAANSRLWKRNRLVADRLLRDLMIQDGASKFRARYYYLAVRLFGVVPAGGKYL